MAEERLQKILAHAGIASRRKAEELIARGTSVRERPYGGGAWLESRFRYG